MKNPLIKPKMESASNPENVKETEVTAFGFLSAMASTSICLPYAVIILILSFLVPESFERAKWALVILAGLSRIKANAVFWFWFFPSEMDRAEDNKNWRSSVKNIVFSHPNTIQGIINLFIDIIIDFTLIYLAFKGLASPIWIIFVFLVCQLLGSLIQGLSLYYFRNQKIFRKISMIIALIAVYTALEINGIVPNFYGNFLRLNHFDKANQLLYILGFKCLFSGISVIVNDSIAKIIKVKTLKR